MQGQNAAGLRSPALSDAIVSECHHCARNKSGEGERGGRPTATAGGLPDPAPRGFNTCQLTIANQDSLKAAMVHSKAFTRAALSACGRAKSNFPSKAFLVNVPLPPRQSGAADFVRTRADGVADQGTRSRPSHGGTRLRFSLVEAQALWFSGRWVCPAGSWFTDPHPQIWRSSERY